MKDFTIKSTTKVTQEDLDNIIDSAIAMCSYWCDEMIVTKDATEPITALSEIPTRGGELTFRIDEPFEEGGKKRFKLTIPKLVKALEKYGEFDFEDFDGPMSDAVLQIALFGEIVYA